MSLDRLTQALSDRYTVERELGEGGMATVYLAQDLKHNRRVALKVLKPELAAVVGAERFLAEIETTANLQHPHVLPLFDSGEADGFLFYVMPYVEGETLRDRLARDKQLPIEESVRIGTAVAGALDYAHRHGVVHRDIKPANILLQDGQPVVSDFGIALAVGAGGGARLTETGLSVGTPFYMSPEQATGDQHIGPASDIYALACVVYEMLVGEPPFLGNTAQAVLGKIIAGGPVSATAARKSVPVNIDAALRKSLEKLPADRFTSAQDFGRALGDPSFRHGTGVAAGAADPRWKRAAIGFAATTVLALGGLLWSQFGTAEPTPRIERFASPFLEDQEPEGLGYQFFDVASDGSFMVHRSGAILWVRRWEDLEATQIRGSGGGWTPSISADGTEVSFWLQSGEVKVAPLAGGPVRTVLEGAIPWQHWGDDGYIYATLAGEGEEGLDVVRVAPSGGVADTLWRAAEGEFSVVLRVLRDGEHAVAWFADANDADPLGELRLVDLATGGGPAITSARWATYLPTGVLLYQAPDSTLMVGRLDERSGEFSEGPVPLVEGIVAFDAADDGSLFYTTGSDATREFELVWVTRDGSALPVEAGWTFDPDVDNRGWEISPDGTKIALKARTDLGNDIWVMELPEGPLSRLTIHAAAERMPRWHPNGTDVTFVSNRSGRMEIWSRRADGVGNAELVYADPEVGVADLTWSPDGRWLVIRSLGIAGASGGRDLGLVEVGVDSVARPLLDSEFDEFDPAISPDGNWLAYVSDETGQPDVFIRPFPDVNSGKVPVSDGGGRAPVWSSDGTEIFYLGGTGVSANDATITARSLMVAELRPGPPMAVTRRRPLFEIPDEFYFANFTTSFDVTPDGERFLMARIANEETPDRRRFVWVKNALTEFRGPGR